MTVEWDQRDASVAAAIATEFETSLECLFPGNAIATAFEYLSERALRSELRVDLDRLAGYVRSHPIRRKEWIDRLSKYLLEERF